MKELSSERKGKGEKGKGMEREWEGEETGREEEREVASVEVKE